MKKEILVYVEDDLLLRDIFEEEMGQYYDVHVFSNPLKSLAYIKEHTGDVSVLLTDFVMSELNGLELIKKTKQLSSTIKCVLLTGYCKNIGSSGELDMCDLVIEKNRLLSIEELISKIKSII